MRCSAVQVAKATRCNPRCMSCEAARLRLAWQCTVAHTGSQQVRTGLFWCVQVIQRLPELQQLDGRAVTEAERASAAESLRREGVVLALMASSACLAHKLVG